MTALIGSRDRAVRRLDAQLQRIAPTALPIVIEGETGVGKNRLAERIHRASRAGRPLVVLDCSQFPSQLLTGELFGHRAGAFTDATAAREGRLTAAGDGTLVIDHLESVPPEGQVALLRVLEEGRFLPLGGASPVTFRARVIALAAATLDSDLASGRVRDDLFHRLAGFRAVIPPLRDRRADIVPLARGFARRGVHGPGRTLTSEVEELLEGYPWPGNVRQLAATITRAALTGNEERISVADLALDGDWAPIEGAARTRRATLAEVSRLYTLWVLNQEHGNVSRAARVLGVSRRTLVRWRSER